MKEEEAERNCLQEQWMFTHHSHFCEGRQHDNHMNVLFPHHLCMCVWKHHTCMYARTEYTPYTIAYGVHGNEWFCCLLSSLTESRSLNPR